MEAQTSWIAVALGFLSGVGVSVVGAVVASLLHRRAESRRRLEEARFRVYMKFMEIHSLYFFVSSAEVRQTQASAELKRQIKSLAWEICDMLRSGDELKEGPQIFRTLMSMGYNSARDRYREMGTILTSLGDAVNPRYLQAAREIGQENLQDWETGGTGRDHTPGFMS